ncbi:hypothetical protein K3E28_004468, partial [Escherichia coli]|nr:hypothetical protein [Escherichia coli]
MFSKIIVCCPGNLVTGGPELLHQFVHQLRLNYIDAEIIYYPFDRDFETPNAYKHYNVKVVSLSGIDKCDNNLVILPETGTKYYKYFKGCQIGIWWLSVDNYFGYAKKDSGFINNLKNLIKIFLRRKISLNKMQMMLHFYQSEYAREFLEKHHLQSIPLSDYLNVNHLINEGRKENVFREKIITYNPKKGIKTTALLKSRFPSFRFKALCDMTPREVREYLEKSMVYIDFGNHPGKDRFPREAAMAGCVIITGRQGSAANNVDVPIPDMYKLDENSDCFITDFEKLINSIFDDFETHTSIFREYREIISKEESKFKQDVELFIRKYIS